VKWELRSGDILVSDAPARLPRKRRAPAICANRRGQISKRVWMRTITRVAKQSVVWSGERSRAADKSDRPRRRRTGRPRATRPSPSNRISTASRRDESDRWREARFPRRAGRRPARPDACAATEAGLRTRDGVPLEDPYAGARVVACFLQLATVDLTLRRYDTDGRRSDGHGAARKPALSVQRKRRDCPARTTSRRVICSVDPVGHIVGPDVDA
jgi:hypothetical protein